MGSKFPKNTYNQWESIKLAKNVQKCQSSNLFQYFSPVVQSTDNTLPSASYSKLTFCSYCFGAGCIPLKVDVLELVYCESAAGS